jgi:hypothetical protein
MGELIGADATTAGVVQSSVAIASIVVSLLALGLFALFQAEKENDDDDSSPGGGLMQPVA